MSTASDVLASTTTTINAMRTAVTTDLIDLRTQAESWSTQTITGVTAPTLAILNTNPLKYSDLTTAINDVLYSIDLVSNMPVLSGLVGTTAYSNTLIGSEFSGIDAPKWAEGFWDNMKTVLSNHVTALLGADSVDAVLSVLSSDTTRAQNALFTQDLSRKQQVLRDIYSAAEANTAALGFSHPNSMTTALKLDAQQKFQFGMDDVARDLMVKLFAWAKESGQFILSQGINAHSADIEFNIRYADILLKKYSEELNKQVTLLREETNLAKERVDLFLKKQEYSLKDYQLKIEKIKDKSALVEAEDRVKIAAYAEDIKNFLTAKQLEIDTNVASRKARVDALTASINGAVSVMNSASQVSVGILTNA